MKKLIFIWAIYIIVLDSKIKWEKFSVGFIWLYSRIVLENEAGWGDLYLTFIFKDNTRSNYMKLQKRFHSSINFSFGIKNASVFGLVVFSRIAAIKLK